MPESDQAVLNVADDPDGRAQPARVGPAQHLIDTPASTGMLWNNQQA